MSDDTQNRAPRWRLPDAASALAILFGIGGLVAAQSAKDQRQDSTIEALVDRQKAADAEQITRQAQTSKDHDLLITTANGVTYLVEQQKMRGVR